MVEEQDIIHMQPISGGKEKAGGPARPGRRRRGSVHHPDAITLFRFSALTFNSHRIHYDAPYANGVEKLPGLVVQGKLIALQLLETVRHFAPDAELAQYEYRSTRPLYSGMRCTLAVQLGSTGRT